MAEMKTKPTDESISSYLNGLPDEKKRQDAFHLLQMMREISGSQPKMWGESIVGFGDYHYVYESGREGDWFVMGFAPRKENFTLYLTCDIEKYAGLLQNLGKYKTGKGCLYIRKLEDVNEDVLRELLSSTCAEQRKTGN